MSRNISELEMHISFNLKSQENDIIESQETDTENNAINNCRQRIDELLKHNTQLVEQMRILKARIVELES